VLRDRRRRARNRQTELPDVVTTEWGLCCRDGAELCQALRGGGRTRDVPLIVVTAWPVASTPGEPWGVGCAAVLLKPVLPNVLVEYIRRVPRGARRGVTGHPSCNAR
jgi:two-component system, OmpR family, phosphate regulon response regulator PhoB